MNYETDVPTENMVELRAEAGEIWSVFKKDVEAAGLKAAALRGVHNETTGIIKKGKGYGFVIEKRSDGEWHWLYDDPK